LVITDYLLATSACEHWAEWK